MGTRTGVLVVRRHRPCPHVGGGKRTVRPTRTRALAPHAEAANGSLAMSVAMQVKTASSSLLRLTGRCRGRLHHRTLRPRQAGAPELGR